MRNKRLLKQLCCLSLSLSLLFSLPAAAWAEESADLWGADGSEAVDDGTEAADSDGADETDTDESASDETDTDETDETGTEGAASEDGDTESAEGESADTEDGEDAEEEEPIELDTGSSANLIAGNQTILDNIYIGDVNVSGMTTEEAAAAVDQRMSEITGYQIQLHMDDESVGVTAAELGVTGDNAEVLSRAAEVGQAGNVIRRYQVQKDLETETVEIAMQYAVDEEMLRTALETYCVPLNRSKKDYGLNHDGGTFTVTNGVRGVTLNEDASVALVADYLTNTWKDGQGSVDLDVEIVEPNGSAEEFADVTDILGQGSTDYSASSAARATNISNGTSKLNGYTLYPGESFSVCNAMVPFTEENGYATAPSYANGSVVESFGGGICQVSTTLYLAVIRSELEVLERHNHSMAVSYVKPSMDAAIAEGYKDFQFRNNTDYPVYIEGYASNGTVYFAVYGKETRSEDRVVTYESETLETIEPTTELVADSTAAFGTITQTQTAHTGKSAKLWKIVTENGVEVSREEFNTSYYQMTPNKYSIGTKTTSSEASSAMYTAISSDDLSQVYAVISAYGG